MSKVAPDSAKTSAPKPHYRCEELIKCVDFYSLTYTCWIIPRNKQTVLSKKINFRFVYRWPLDQEI